MPTPDVAARGGFYHVVLRGNRCETLFSTPADRRALNSIASDAMSRFEAVLHCYCLLPHQFRVLMQIEDGLLIKALRKIASRYSRYKRKTSGTDDLFEKPFDARRVETGWEFLQLLRAIHLSPVMANKVVTPDDYNWSSHRAYLGFASVARVTTDFGLSLLAADASLARVAYHRFIAEGLAVDARPKLPLRPGALHDTGGGAPPVKSDLDDPFLARAAGIVIGSRRGGRRFASKKRRAPRRYVAVY